MTTHVVTFERNKASNLWRATCTCGWREMHSDAAFVQSRAAIHDDDGWVVDNPQNFTGYKEPLE